ncbi:hypothetical protein OROGR_000447 [Orobanche gracilis]
MECNKDEALRAKEIAERKFVAKDIKGAKKFALKARKIYPELEGISQLLMTLEVYMSAEDDKRHGESNWYNVLGVTPLADEDTIRFQYRKLAVLLHPDKNRSIGAKGAFQLVSQAWGLISDKSKRLAYDQRYQGVFQLRKETTKEGPSGNGFCNFSNTADSQTKAQKGNNNSNNDNNNNNISNNISKKNPTSVPNPSHKKERRIFWTVCTRCLMQYEYLRMYCNHNLLCPNCHEAYFAIEIGRPPTKISKATSRKGQKGSDATRNNFEWVPFSESTGAQSADQAASTVQQAYEKVNRERQKTQAAARKEEVFRRKNLASKRPADSLGHSDFAKRRKEVESQVNTSCSVRGSFRKCNSKCGVGMKCLLMEKACEEIPKKLNESMLASMVKNVADEAANVKDASATYGSMSCPIKQCELEEKECHFSRNKLIFSSLDGKLVEQMSVDVSDPDFHDFDKERTEKCFSDNQVWAVYDDHDGMPRHYAMIQSVISINPFKVKISWLSSVIHSRLVHVNCFLNEFSKTCGEFGMGRVEICYAVECFSHIVRCVKHSSKAFQIFPRKGDVWALYRNWSPEWNELTEDDVIHKYDMVEVLDDYDEEFGVIVIPLVKVAGFKSVFRSSIVSMEIRRIPKEEMSRFSHQVPCHLLTGKEGSKLLKGCCELDSAAIPLQFLEVMSNIEETELVESDEDIESVSAVDCEGKTIAHTVEGVPEFREAECRR